MNNKITLLLLLCVAVSIKASDDSWIVYTNSSSDSEVEEYVDNDDLKMAHKEIDIQLKAIVVTMREHYQDKKNIELINNNIKTKNLLSQFCYECSDSQLEQAIGQCRESFLEVWIKSTEGKKIKMCIAFNLDTAIRKILSSIKDEKSS